MVPMSPRHKKCMFSLNRSDWTSKVVFKTPAIFKIMPVRVQPSSPKHLEAPCPIYIYIYRYIHGSGRPKNRPNEPSQLSIRSRCTWFPHRPSLRYEKAESKLAELRKAEKTAQHKDLLNVNAWDLVTAHQRDPIYGNVYFD